MYHLLVSCDCGTNYHEEASSEDAGHFKDQCHELDKQMLRWVVEDDDENIIYACRIHTSVLSAIQKLNEE